VPEWVADSDRHPTWDRSADNGESVNTKKRLSDGDGGHYFSSLHTRVTAWYLLGLQADDPFHVILPTR
jgi:hypothetical protein